VLMSLAGELRCGVFGANSDPPRGRDLEIVTRTGV